MVHHTSRRELLVGAAALSAMPVSALGGVPVFDVVLDTFPGAFTFEGRIATAAAWLDLDAPALAYDPDDLRGGPVLNEDLVAWLRHVGHGVGNWIISGTPATYTREQAHADFAQAQDEARFMEILTRLDEHELRLLADATERGVRGEVDLETALVECRAQIDAYRLAKAA